jgi:hypothetical protein
MLNTNTVIIIFDIIGAVLLILFSIYMSKIIGWFGELWTKQELKKLPKDQYKVLNNVFLTNGERMCQIDHIVVSPYGIFVIETKQYNGKIYGGKYDKYWVRYCRRNRKVFYENPIRQNYGHCMMIKELLHLDDSSVFNIACIPSLHVYLKIRHDGELVRNTTICKKILSYTEPKLGNYNEIFEYLNSQNIKDKAIRKAHIKNIKKNIV